MVFRWPFHRRALFTSLILHMPVGRCPQRGRPFTSRIGQKGISVAAPTIFVVCGQSKVVTGRRGRWKGVVRGRREGATGRGRCLIEVNHRGLESGRRSRSRSDLFTRLRRTANELRDTRLKRGESEIHSSETKTNKQAADGEREMVKVMPCPRLRHMYLSDTRT